MGEKTVNELAGIGEVMGKRLAAKGRSQVTLRIIYRYWAEERDYYSKNLSIFIISLKPLEMQKFSEV
jgi:hypothetical protein